MRIVIAAPPKAGNQWLKCMLATTYGLRWLRSNETPPGGDVAAFAEWVAGGGFPDGTIYHQHYRFSEEFCRAAAAAPCHVVTILRNPYDVFVSLYFHMQNFKDRWVDRGPQAMMIDKPIDHPDVLYFLGRHFRSNLAKGREWLESGRSVVVRYERLHADPVAELKAATRSIRPVDDAAIAAAVETCGAENMRRLNPGMAKHVRAATVGDWQNHLGQAHLEVFHDRYADLVRDLGYEVLGPVEGGGEANRFRRGECTDVRYTAGEGGQPELNYDIVDRGEAPPPPPPPRGRRAEELNTVINALEPGKVARIEPTGDEKLGGIRNQVYRAAGRLGKAVVAWDDERYIYVELAQVRDDEAAGH